MIKVIAFILATFVLGNVSGAFLGARFQEDRHEKRGRIDNLGPNLMDFFEKKLSLTAEQTNVIEPMIGKACGEIRNVYKRGDEDIEGIILKYHQLIADQLTPEQDKILKELEAERVRRNRERGISGEL